MKKAVFLRVISVFLCAVLLAAIVPSLSGSISADAISYSGSSSYASGKYYTALKAVTKTGNQRTDLVNVAKSQIGYQEGGSSSQLSGTVRGSGNYTEYGRWYGMQDMWCAMFVSWCANVAGISTSIIPSHSYTPTGLNWFINKGQAYSRAKCAAGTYTPKAGDIIYFKSSRNSNITNHIGIVTSYSGGTIYTVEGNTSSATISTNGGAVASKSYSISNTYIVYVCCPAYTSGSGGGGGDSSPSGIEALCYDATIYRSRYADLTASYAENSSGLYQHWLSYGIKEGRCASLILDLKYYVENNPDLKSTFGTDYASAYQHFITSGYKEGRKSSPVYDAKYYKEKNSDLSSMGGLELAAHFYDYGAKEGRRGSPEFDISYYKTIYASELGSKDNLYAYRHYIMHGVGEGRLPKDTTKPVISNISVSNVSVSGYTVTCKVSDNYKLSHIRFPTWVGSGEANWLTGTISGSTATCTIRTSDFGNATGTYTTHIYLYDSEGNCETGSTSANVQAPVVVTDTAKPVISDVKITDISATGYTVSCKVTDDYGVTSVIFPTWTNVNGQDDITNNSGTASGSTYTYRVNVSDYNHISGVYITHIYARDAAGNEGSYQQGSITVPAVSYPESDYIPILEYNGSQWSDTGSVIWTSANASTFTAVWWNAAVASKNLDGNYTIKQKYICNVDSKAITVTGTDILIAIHDGIAGFDELGMLSVGDIITLNGIDVINGVAAANAYVGTPAKFELISSSDCKLDEAVTVPGGKTTVSSLANQFKCSVVVVTAGGNVLASNDYVGTGCVVQRRSATGTVVESVPVVIPGDINGDGLVNTADYIGAKRVIKGKSSLNGSFVLALDSNCDGAVGSVDYIIIKKVCKG